jgi:dynein heavy chain
MFKYFNLQLFQLGLDQFTWKTEESADFIETANALVCTDLHHNLDIVQTNCTEIMDITVAWSRGVLDIFIARESKKSYDIKELVNIQKYVYGKHV